MTSPLLSVRNLRVELPLNDRWVPAVDGIDFDLTEGQALGILGESGCGKTLAARALLDLVPEGARLTGSVIYRGRDLLRLAERDWRTVRGREIALVFQEPAAALDPVRTIGDQSVEAIRAHSSVSAAQARREARRLLGEGSFCDADRGL